MASSSASSVTKIFKYDVFLSFRGETRLNFVDHLNFALKQRNIYTYKDDEKMKKGSMINEDLTESIRDSRFYIIVFSKNYPSSSWCLDELVKIMECHKETGHKAYPVFYDVKPSEVRDQEGEFGEAFARLKEGKAIKSDDKGAFEKWREALNEAAGLAGWELKKTADGHEATFIRKIVEMVSLELRPNHLNINEKLVGMESQIEDVLSLLGTGGDDVHLIGIKGMGGSGKTTLARALFDRISLQFEGRSFVDNVREVSNALSSGLTTLQNQILSDVLNDQGMRVSSVFDGKDMLKRRMGGRKVLLVLDDVDHMEQLEALAGNPNWFEPGSVIIITTRDEQMLVGHGVKLIHKVNLLSDEEAILLFSRYASGGEIPIQEYEELSGKVVGYAAGLPLTIKVLGSFLCGKSQLEWIDAIERLKKIPLEETLRKLEISYIGLEEEYKEIFLDVACMLKGWTKDSTIKALESRGFYARIGLRVLEQKSLITTYGNYKDGGERVGMHDHIEEMGKNIVRRMHPNKPNKHSRLWIEEEIEDIFINELGTEATKCIMYSRSMMNSYKSKLGVGIIMKGLRKMKDLRFLHISWHGASLKHDDISPSFPRSLRYLHINPYPFMFLPKTCEADNLVTLMMPENDIVELWEGEDRKVLDKLRFLDLNHSKLRILNLELTPKLETLSLYECPDLEKLHMPVPCPRLRFLELFGSKIRILHLGLTPNLETLIYGRSNELVELYMPVECPKLKSLILFGSTLGALDLGPAPNLERLTVEGEGELVELHMPIECPKLKTVELWGSRLGAFDLRLTPNIEKLNLKGDLEKLYMPIKCVKLRFLKLCGIKFRTLDLGLTPNVEELDLSGDLEELYMPGECLKLRSFTLRRSFKLHSSKLITFDLGLTPNLEELDLSGLVEIYTPVESLKLRSLTLYGSKLRTLDLELTPNLEALYLTRCYDLAKLHVPNGCLKLKNLSLIDTNLRSPDLGLTPNLEWLYINKCYNLVELYVPDGCLNLRKLNFRCSEFRMINLVLCPNLERLEIAKCFNLVELYLPDGCPKLKFLDLIDTNLRSLDLGLAPILESLILMRCNNLVDLHLPRSCLNLRYLILFESKLRNLDIGMAPKLTGLELINCFNLEELHMGDGCQKLARLTINHSKLRIIDLGSVPNLEELSICECNDLLELHMPSPCLNLKTVEFLANSKLRTIELGSTPNLEELHLRECYDLEELHIGGECQKLVSVKINHSKLRTLDLGPTPNLQTLKLRKCYDLEELHIGGECQKLVSIKINRLKKLRTLDLGPTPNLQTLKLRKCYDLEELHIGGECQKLVSVNINRLKKLRTLDLGPTPNLQTLQLRNCYDLKKVWLGVAPNLEDLILLECNVLVELQMPSSCPNLTVLYATNSKLMTFELGPSPKIKKLDLGNCSNYLEEFKIADECQNLTYLEISRSKLKTLTLGFAPNLEMLYLCESNDLVEFHMPGSCLNLRVMFLTNSKLRKLDLGLTPNLEELDLGNCHHLEELHMASECPKLEYLEINYSNLKTLDLSLTPNIKKLDLKGCYKLVEVHVPIGGLKNLVYLDLSGCLRFRSFLFQIKDDTDESFQFGPLAELSFILKNCPIHPENKFPKFQFTCLYKEDLPSLTRQLEKLICGGFCACENLRRFSRNIFGLRSYKKKSFY